ncbi:MAG: response regulator [Gammaproteobacteria bacterium]|nr:response regulator [Gammaproteobacteria bacterium]MDH3506991.1 response regulator [Gammaproteobacteria bacterium]
MSQDDVYTTREAALRLGVSLRTVQLWVESGTLPAWKTLGGHRRISREAVDRLVREQEVSLEIEAADQRLTILVVEDERSLQELYEHTLGGWDLPLDIITAADGYEGLLMIGEKRPDLLITDLSMPGMDGLRMIRTLKSAPEFRDLQIIVVTALDDTEIEDRGGVPEGVTVFRKPIPFAELESIVREHYTGSP